MRMDKYTKPFTVAMQGEILTFSFMGRKLGLTMKRLINTNRRRKAKLGKISVHLGQVSGATLKHLAV